MPSNAKGDARPIAKTAVFDCLTQRRKGAKVNFVFRRWLCMLGGCHFFLLFAPSRLCVRSSNDRSLGSLAAARLSFDLDELRQREPERTPKPREARRPARRNVAWSRSIPLGSNPPWSRLAWLSHWFAH